MLGVHASIRASVSVSSHLRQHANGGGKVQSQREEQVRSGSFWTAELKRTKMLGANWRVWYLHEELPLGGNTRQLLACPGSNYGPEWVVQPMAVAFLCCNAGEYTASVSNLMWMHE
jgi:hypothetical protein